MYGWDILYGVSRDTLWDQNLWSINLKMYCLLRCEILRAPRFTIGCRNFIKFLGNLRQQILLPPSTFLSPKTIRHGAVKVWSMKAKLLFYEQIIIVHAIITYTYFVKSIALQTTRLSLWQPRSSLDIFLWDIEDQGCSGYFRFNSVMHFPVKLRLIPTLTSISIVSVTLHNKFKIIPVKTEKKNCLSFLGQRLREKICKLNNVHSQFYTDHVKHISWLVYHFAILNN